MQWRVPGAIRALLFGVICVAQICAFNPSGLAAGQGAPRVLFINPAPPEDQYWTLVTRMMQAAAQDLGVELEVQHAFHSGDYTLKYATLAAERAVKPHYIIFRNVDEIGEDVFKVTGAAGINTITIDAPFQEKELAPLGGPRKTYPRWLGQVVPNSLGASDQMTQVLIGEVMRRGFKGLIDIVAMTGPEDDIGSQVRLFGLKRGLKDHRNARLKHAFPSAWDSKVADREAFKALRYALNAPVWWGADDNIAEGMVNVLRNTHRKLGQDTFVGAFNWTQPMLTAVVQNQVHYLAGGSFVQGAAALILAHDHFRGKDFAEVGLNYTMDLGILYRDNLKSTGRIMISDAWDRIDFRRFSRATNPALTQYDFTVNRFLRAVLGQ